MARTSAGMAAAARSPSRGDADGVWRAPGAARPIRVCGLFLVFFFSSPDGNLTLSSKMMPVVLSRPFSQPSSTLMWTYPLAASPEAIMWRVTFLIRASVTCRQRRREYIKKIIIKKDGWIRMCKVHRSTPEKLAHTPPAWLPRVTGLGALCVRRGRSSGWNR